MNMRTPILILMLLLGITCAFAQSWGGLNYAAGMGECELDVAPRDGVADGWIAFWAGQQDTSWAAEGIQLSVSSRKVFRGRFAQQISINRTKEYPGRFVIYLPAIDPSHPPFIVPPQGTPLLVRARYIAENVSNAQINVNIYSGSTRRLIGSYTSNQMGWQTLSAIEPLTHNNQGQPLFYLEFEISLGSGDSRAQIAIDSVEVLWIGYTVPQRMRPNPLKIAEYNTSNSHHQILLNPQPDFVITAFSHVAALREYYPAVSLGIYVDMPQTANLTPVPWNDLYGGYEFVLRNHPDWFLRDDQGNIISNPGYPYLYPLNISLPEVRQQAISSLSRMDAEAPLPEWIFFDNVGAWWLAQQFPGILQYWTEYISQVSEHVHNRLNRKVVINAGAFAGAFLDGNAGTQWIQHVDAVMLEHTITFYGGSPRDYRYHNYRRNRSTAHHTEQTWWATLCAVNAYPNKKWLLVCMSNHSNRDMIRYILASYFVMMHENTYLMIDARGSSEQNKYLFWSRCPEAWIPLGQPTGSWRVQAGTVADYTGALFARDFEYGIVLVNPTSDKEYTYTLPRAYKDWDGTVLAQGTTLTIRPRQGVALYAAPEIVLEITPQQITALPGEIVTFQVRCRNQGLQSGTNLQVSVPLPDGVEFISASDGGQYSNRQVRWTLPRLDAGQTRTLTFQARIQ
jgi:uncharacterized repeat protein (TIGR01451 family)